MAQRTPQPFTVELVVSDSDPRTDRILATLHNVTLAQEVFGVAMRLYPDQPLILCHGSRIIRQEPLRCWDRRNDGQDDGGTMAMIRYVIETGFIDGGRWVTGGICEEGNGFDDASAVEAVWSILRVFRYEPYQGTHVRVMRGDVEVACLEIDETLWPTKKG